MIKLVYHISRLVAYYSLYYTCEQFFGIRQHIDAATACAVACDLSQERMKDIENYMKYTRAPHSNKEFDLFIIFLKIYRLTTAFKKV